MVAPSSTFMTVAGTTRTCSLRYASNCNLLAWWNAQLGSGRNPPPGVIGRKCVRALQGRGIDILLTIAVAVFGAAVIDISRVSNDVSQHLIASLQLIAGHGITTYAPYYPEHYQQAIFPPALTTWPPGLSLLVAPLAAIGIDAFRAAAWLNVAALLSTAIGIRLLARRMGCGPVASFLAAAIWTCHPLVWSIVASGSSDLPMTFMGIAAVMAWDRSRRSPSHGYLLLAVAGFALGSAFALRYAGAFIIAGLAPLMCMQLYRSGTPFNVTVRRLLCFTCPLALIGLLVVLRNYLAVGSLSGRIVVSTAPDSTTFAMFVAKAAGEFAVGSSIYMPFPLLTWTTGAACAACLLLGLLLVFRTARRHGFSAFRRDAWLARILTALAVSTPIILLLMGYLISPEYLLARYFVPALPAALVCLFALASRPVDDSEASVRAGRVLPVAVGALVAALVGCFVVRTVSRLEVERERSAWQTIAQSAKDLQKLVVGTGREPLRVISNENQKLALALRSPAFGLPGSFSSRSVWTADNVRQLARRYGVHYVVFFPGLYDSSDHNNDNRLFFKDLADGRNPDWLTPVLVQDHYRIYVIR
jgi:hypothetical protein